MLFVLRAAAVPGTHFTCFISARSGFVIRSSQVNNFPMAVYVDRGKCRLSSCDILGRFVNVIKIRAIPTIIVRTFLFFMFIKRYIQLQSYISSLCLLH
jgi:hypothetical protein